MAQHFAGTFLTQPHDAERALVVPAEVLETLNREALGAVGVSVIDEGSFQRLLRDGWFPVEPLTCNSKSFH